VTRFYRLPFLDSLRYSTFVIRHSIRIRTAKVFSRTISGEDFWKELKRWDYEPGGGVVSAAGDSPGDSAVAGDSDAAVGDSVVEGGVVASVVAVGGLVAAGLAAGSVVSVFCSHAARSAALARMQIYFFIVLIGRVTLL
jgi:hypothetical protein